MWSIGDFVPHCWEEIVYCRCDGNRDGSAISDQNWIKNREAAASRFTLPRLNWQINLRMNEPIFAPLLFASLSFLDSFFPSGLLLRKNPSARLGMLSFHSMLPLKFQGTWMVPSSYLFLRKQTSERKTQPNFNILYIFLKYVWIFLPINAKKNLLQHLFLRSIRTFWSSIWSSTVEVPFICIDLCRFSIDVPPSGPENVPKPGLLPYESPLSAVSSTCKEIMWDKCYGSVRLALTASLTKKCVVWNCALSKWQCLHNETTHPRRHPINAQFLMGTSWRLCRVPQCRKSLTHGGWVCLWVASCHEGLPSAKHVTTHSRVDTLQDLRKELIWLRSTNCWRFLSVISGESLPYHIQKW